MSKVHRLGFTRLDADEGKDGRHKCNIIFVHGLRGHPQRTWGDDKNDRLADNAPSSSRLSLRHLILGRKWRASSDDPSNTHDAVPRHPFWPRDLLATDFPQARVWTYGYNADVIEGLFGASNKNSVSQHGRDFAIKLERRLDDQEPIIFVAHSLGGIIVKDAISRSDPLQQRTTAIVFLGTPHRGSSAADWAQMASNLAAVTFQDSNKKVTGALMVDSEVLGNIHEQFIKIAMKRGIRLHSFQEGRSVSGVRGISGKIVGDFSSSLGLPDEKVESMDADHRQMVKCTDREDTRYRDICDVLRQFFRSRLSADSSPSQMGREPSQSHVQALETTVGGTLASSQPQSGPCFFVPFPENKRFVGRTETLQRLRKMLFDDDTPGNAAIVGLGGVGKTQVALQVAYWVKETKPGWSVYWLPAFSMASFEQACAEMARDLCLEASSQEDPKELVRRYLCSPQSGNWLLIVDNADDMGMLLGTADSSGFHGYLPTNTHGRVLFTTRSTDVARAIVDDNFAQLSEMDDQEARDFLQKLLSKDVTADDVAVVALLRDLTYLPLAISQAAAYIKRNRIPISGYLSLLRDTDKEAIGLLSREFPDLTRYRESRHAVAITWLISFEEIRQVDKPAAELLSFMSQVEPRAIPQSMLPSPHTREELIHALGTLRGYAFLQEREDASMYDMHSLVHLATRGWVQTQDGSGEVYQAAVAHLATIFMSDEWEQRETWRQSMPHVLRTIHGAAGRGDWGAEECQLGFWAGRCLRVEGRIAEAVEMLEHVVAVKERTRAEDHPDRLASQHELAGAYRANGQVQKAVEILEHVVAVKERTRAEDHPDRLASQHALAGAYQANGQVEKAVNKLEHVVAVRERMLAEDHPSRLASQHELAGTYRANGQVQKAVEILEHVVAVKERTRAEDHQSRLASQHELAGAYQANGQVKKAVNMLEHVVAVKERTRAEDHPSRLASQHELAGAYQANGQVEKAIEILEHVVAVSERTLAEDHPDRLASQHELAGAYQANGQVEKAVEILEHVVAVSERTLAEDHPSRLASQHELAGAYQANRQLEKAVEILEHVVAVEERTLSEDHPDRLASQHALAGAYQANRQLEKAVEILEHVVAVEERTLSEDHPDRLASQHALAGAYQANGQVEKAVKMLDHVVAVKATFMSNDHPSRIVSERLLTWTRSAGE